MVEQVFLYTENGEEQLKTLCVCTKENVKMKVRFPKKSPSERTVTLVLGHISEEWWKKSFVPCRLPRDAIIFNFPDLSVKKIAFITEVIKSTIENKIASIFCVIQLYLLCEKYFY